MAPDERCSEDMPQDNAKKFGGRLSREYDGSQRMSSDYRTGSAADPSSGPSDVERTTARYVFAISTLSTGSDERVTTGELNKCLDVSPASVTEMVAKLDDRSLVDYEKYQGVRLTGQGQELATGIAWRLCVVTSFFDSVLDTNLDEDTAFDIGFTLPEDGVCHLRERIQTSCLEICPEAEGRHAHCEI